MARACEISVQSMYTSAMTMHTHTLSDLRRRGGEIIRRAAAHETTIITDHDVPVAVVMNFGDWEDIEDTIAILRNRAARAEGAQPVPHEEAKRLLREEADKAATA